MNKILLSVVCLFPMFCSSFVMANDYSDACSIQMGNTIKQAQQSSVQELNDANFADKTSSGLLIVDFYADWCPPCQRLAPIYAKVAEELKENISFFKINANNRLAAEAKGIQYLPTLIIFKDGKEIARRVGGASEAQLKEFIGSYLQ